MLSFTIGKNSISIYIDGEFNNVPTSAANYPALLAELQKPADERDEATIKGLVSTKKMVERFSMGHVTISENSEVFFDGKLVHNYMTDRMIQIMAEGHEITPWVLFMENVMANPTEYTHNELYEWMEGADLPLTPDGCFIAFKKVKDNYTDCHTGMFDNSVGAVVEMTRSACDPNRNNECSTGFHFCSAGYLSSFRGERVMVLKVNPRDVTAIPKDYKYTKGRTCRYEVIGELDKQSDAYKAAWKRGVVKFEDDKELPDVNFQSRPAAGAKPLKPLVVGAAREAAVAPPAKAPQKAKAAKQAAPAPKPAPTPVPAPAAAPKAKASPVKKAVAAVKAAVTGTKQPRETFVTSDKRTFTKAQVQAALDAHKGATRPAARDLGIGESTLRGWKKDIE